MKFDIKQLPFEEVEAIGLSSEFDELFDHEFLFKKSKLFSEIEKEMLAKRQTLLKEYRKETGFGFVAEVNGKIVGYSYGYAEDNNGFYVQGSAVLPDYRLNGIYKALCRAIIEEAKKRHYSFVSSEHSATNNAVILPKLKEGFVIVGQKIAYNRGVFVELMYPINEKIKHAVDVRSGFRPPNAGLKSVLGI